MTSLERLGRPAVEPLVNALGNKSRFVRRGATKVLEKLGGLALEPLIAALKDDRPLVCLSASDILGKLKDARAVESLIAVLKNSSKVQG